MKVRSLNIPAIFCRTLLTGASLLLLIIIANAQKVATIASKHKIVIGEQISVIIKVDGLPDNSIQQDFVFPDTVNHIEILSHKTEPAGQSAVVHHLAITSFDSGQWRLPAFQMTLTDNRKLFSEPLDFNVVPVDVAHMHDYHDIKDILEVLPQNNWIIVALVVLLALTSLFALLWFITSRVSPEVGVTGMPDLQQRYDELIQRLTLLGEIDTGDKKAVRHFFIETSSGVRAFSELALQRRSAHYTTDEYMLEAKGALQDETLERSYFQFLRLADAVKFARYDPPPEEIVGLIPLLKNVVSRFFTIKKGD